MRAATDIKVHYAFHVPGINVTNPVTFEDTGFAANFEATRDITAGEEIQPEDCHPRMHAAGPYRNVTRAAGDDDVAVLGWGGRAS